MKPYPQSIYPKRPGSDTFVCTSWPEKRAKGGKDVAVLVMVDRGGDVERGVALPLVLLRGRRGGIREGVITSPFPFTYPAASSAAAEFFRRLI